MGHVYFPFFLFYLHSGTFCSHKVLCLGSRKPLKILSSYSNCPRYIRKVFFSPPNLAKYAFTWLFTCIPIYITFIDKKCILNGQKSAGFDWSFFCYSSFLFFIHVSFTALGPGSTERWNRTVNLHPICRSCRCCFQQCEHNPLQNIYRAWSGSACV